MLTFGSLFSGIGGFDLGLERAGLQPIFQCEIDKDCQRVLKRHWPNTRLYQNVKEINRSNTASPDVLVGGFPCQDLSVAGNRAGLAGERSGLWFEFHRIIKELKPGRVVIENVPGLLSSESGRDFAVILRGLAECGYHASWRVLDAQYFGLAQRRRRVFIVASLGNGSCAEILFESESGAWDSPPGREAGQRVAGTIAAGAHPGSYNGRDAERDMLIAWDNGQGDPNGEETEKAYALNGQANQGIAFQQNVRNEVRLINSDGQIVGALQAQPGMKQQNYIAYDNCLTPWDAESKRIHSANGIAPTLAGSDGQGGQRFPNYATPFGVRRLTPVECERLQGFPDGFTEGQSDSVRYRQLGNAVAVPCSEWIGRRILRIARRNNDSQHGLVYVAYDSRGS